MRFLVSNPPADDFQLPDLEALLDALESALVTPETPVFDAVRRSWQPVGRHPEVRAAWAERARFLPPGAHRPELPPQQEDPEEIAEQEQRKRAWDLVKQGHRPSPRRRPRAPMVGVMVVILLLGLLAWGVVALAGGITRVAGAIVRSEAGR
ncbi:MAG TPA: hypothetical protein VF653_02815 [Methylomirabilota bacterium]